MVGEVIQDGNPPFIASNLLAPFNPSKGFERIADPTLRYAQSIRHCNGGGRIDMIAGQSTESGQGGYLRLWSGNATAASQSFILIPILA